MQRNTGAIITYTPNRWNLIFLGSFFGIVGILGCISIEIHSPQPAATFFLTGFCLYVSTLLVTGAIRNKPQITILANGIQIDTEFGRKKFASWDSVDEFEKQFIVLGSTIGLNSALAKITGNNVSPNISSSLFMHIRGPYNVSFDKMITQINTYRKLALNQKHHRA